MKKLSFIAAILFLSATWVVAQQSGTSTTSSSNNSQTSIRGCLSGAAGSYTLTDESGKTFQLAGDTSDLSSHVGQEIKVTGSESASSSSNSGMTPSSSSSSSTSPTSSSTSPTSSTSATSSSSSSSSQPTFNVSNVKKVSDTCSNTK